MTPRGRWHVFRKIWRRNSWGSAESVSGPGSTVAPTETPRCPHLDYPFERCIGIDILPRADAVFSRDFLVHLPFAQIEQVMARRRIAGSRYVFATTFVGWDENRDCRLGGRRPLDMRAPPLNRPAPLAVIAEREPNPTDPARHKSMGVWELRAGRSPWHIHNISIFRLRYIGRAFRNLLSIIACDDG